MRMMIAGGGTGGHLFPGLAVAEQWQRSGRGEVYFVGSRFGIEARVIPNHGYPFLGLPVRGVRGRGVRGWMEFALHLPPTLYRCWRVQREWGPDVVVGLGGYSSVPVVLVAWLRRLPVVLLEQNAHPGLANRILSRVATRVCTTFAESARYFPAGKAVHTGNPVRRFEPKSGGGRSRGNSFTVLVIGGSQGARSINRAVVEAAPVLARAIPELRWMHQTGLLDESWVRAEYEKHRVHAEVHGFIDDMASAYAAADLVICRAGASTLAELALVGVPAVLIPYPFAADNHQQRNAESWLHEGAAEMILDRDLNPANLCETVLRLVRNPDRFRAMADNARRLARPEAAEAVARVCEEVAGQR